ncbi:caspase family protein [Streptomyces sp. NPDC089424]|uniref:caspase, EACC1-associated type n=1 Tax=Streptomyces sp. NPDC089424 TaxID=3365917 RepID=UPI0037F9359E
MTSDGRRSRAVLFGVHEFRELACLDGVRHNIPVLRELLTSEDVGGLTEEDCTVVAHDGTQQQLLDALHSAAREATDLLLVYYAGHGHFGGRDRSFLLATRESSGQRPYHSVKYDDIRELVSGSAAHRKVVVIDCCFSGRALSMAEEQTPTQLDMEITGACVLTSASETERSLCLPEGSVFTVELTGLLRDGLSGELAGGRRGEHLADLTMTDVYNALHSRLQGKVIEGLRVPQPRMSTRDLGHQIVLARNRAYTGTPGGTAVCGATPPAEEPEWVTAARDHPLWNYVTDERGSSLLRDTATALAAQAAAAVHQREMPTGPWRSQSFTDRLAEWTDGLLLDSSLRPDDLGLSAAEVFLLVTHPYLHAAFWQHNEKQFSAIGPTTLTEAQSTSKARRSYETFLQGRPRLVRRALRSSDPEASDAIGWWLFHRWLARQARLYHPTAVEALLDRLAVPLGKPSPREKRLVDDVLEPSLVAQLLRAPQLPGLPEDVAARPRSVGAAETAQRVRAHQLAELLRIAHLFAVDPIALPDVLVDHIGIGYAVDLPDVHRTLAGLRWEPNGRTRTLKAVCHHLAVDLGLRQHAAALDTVLARIDISTGEEQRPALLRNLPVHVTAEQVTAAVDENGRAAYESTELRFRLADDRIQELLMGEELYGDPALAIRELYQNALDACRYREARTNYLRATGTQMTPYRGSITFTQGTDERGPYLECRDNGIGMGEVELRDVFSHAGMRFSDLSEYLEEKAKWQDKNIFMYPNSQFGVGVLSYFMLADDVTVTTCRLTPEGLPGQQLRVEIAGPGSLFRIQRMEQCPDAYTSVRLHLRPPDTVSCVDVLRRFLWLSDFDVKASDEHGETQTWQPKVLSDVAPLGTSDPHEPKALRGEGAVVVPSSTPAVWWCSMQGAVLADGLWAGVRLFGAVVNLTGPNTPRLTVDRRRIIDPDRTEIERLLRLEIPSLLAAKDAVLTHHWLERFLHESPETADLVFSEAVAANFRPWRIARRDADITQSGFFIGDESLAAHHVTGGFDGPSPSSMLPAESFRLRPLIRAGVFHDFSTQISEAAAKPTPSDTLLLLPGWSPGLALPNWDDSAWANETVVGISIVLRGALRSGRPTEDVIARLNELGFRTPAGSVPEPRPGDLSLLSLNNTGQAPWLNHDSAVSPGHILRVANGVERSFGDIADRLRELGYRVPDLSVPVKSDDLPILNQQSAGRTWLDPEAAVHPAHILQASLTTGRSVQDITTRLNQLGHRTPIPPDPLTSDDLLILKQEFAPQPWLDPEAAVHPAHVLRTSHTTGRSVKDITARLEQLGYRTTASPHLEPDDLRILSRDLDEQAPWLNLDNTVHPAHVLRASHTTGRSAQDITARLEQLGYRTTTTPHPEADDLRILSHDLDQRPPWLEAERPVSPAHILRAASLTRRSPRDIVSRLHQLGFSLPDFVVVKDA